MGAKPSDIFKSRKDLLDPGFLISKRSSIARCGCYVVNPPHLQPDEYLAVPLKFINYDIQIVNGLANITLTQEYHNPLNYNLEVEYSFPTDPKNCFHSFQAIFGDQLLQGIIKQKQQARVQYQQAVQQGLKAAYGQIDDKSKDIFNIKIGNIPPNTRLLIKIMFTQELQVSMSKFWKLIIPSTISPRYMNDATPDPFISKLTGNPTAARYGWTFKVNLKTSRPITLYQSTSHELEHLSMKLDKKEADFSLKKQSVPNKDFVLVYSVEQHQQPSYVLGRTDAGSSVMVSLIPKFNDLTYTEALKLQSAKQNAEYNMENSRGEFIFLLDRSGSMSGARMQRAKEALVIFIKSLPQDSFFEVYSFGNSHTQMFGQSQPYSDVFVNQAIANISSMTANLGGTEIEAPLRHILRSAVKPGYPKQVYLLTDGQVNNTERVIQLVKDNIHFSRVHAIGVGNGASPALIKGCAEKGKGKHVFIQDNQNVAGQIIKLLEDSLSPVISNFKLTYDKSIVQSVIPNPQNMPYILKDENVNLYFTFKPGVSGTTQIKLAYYNSQTKATHMTTQAVDLDSPGVMYVDKMAHYKEVNILCEALDNSEKLNTDILVEQVSDLKKHIVQQSIRNQVLCKLTAFLCVEMKLVDGKIVEEGKLFESKKVVVPQYSPCQQLPQPKIANMAFPQSSSMLFGAPVPCSAPSSSLFGGSVNRYQPVPMCANTTTTTTTSGLFGQQNQFMPPPPPPPPSFSLPPPPPPPSASYNLPGCSNPSRLIPHFTQPQRQSLRSMGQSRKQQSKKMQSLDLLSFGDAKQNTLFSSPQPNLSNLSSVPKQNMIITPPAQNSDPVKALVSLQTTTGTWTSIEVLKLIGVSEADFNQLVKQFNSAALLLTILVVEYFDRKVNKPEYILMLKKSKNWINKEMANQPNLESVALAARGLVK